MEAEGTLKSRTAERKGKGRGRRLYYKYSSDIGAYLDFLKKFVGAGEKTMEEVKEVVLGFAPVLNKIGPADIPRVNAIQDISFCAAIPEYFLHLNLTREEIKESLFETLDEINPKTGLTQSLLPISKPLVVPVTERLFQYPRDIDLPKNVLEKAAKNRLTFVTAMWASSQVAADKLSPKLKKGLEEVGIL
ncbi:hypothetical protein AKJ47_00600 [candidate division MSBL1 archaeon SCGC-AAA261G05]|uniref:Uncharacterized protein n=3 Tax=candidate division MSBL1 TaxID=215777 RepID=A0A133V111_9EURY|nr:hypothetical protein AKJ42_01595 [candidate division MSBL1 archaeon SCGC-AAA261C02]KXB04132.1 hypothetical protein AKJ47_00600 [candidate division MSBL1 archaeon SCGC-AAA261G05]KXB05030.1 hypothetical protein AKJ48_00490 [candidate division MSBL1 archaeon SCGC-AAA261O19]